MLPQFEDRAPSIIAIRKHLQVLHLSHDCSFDLNGLPLKLCSSWLHIHSSELVDSPTVTFHGLFAALPSYPHLHMLCISTDDVIDVDPAAETFQCIILQELYLAQPDVAGAKAVAHIIFFVLPCID
ncbi:hypothetical protein BDR07DRAFT_1391772 [Suillus spraguei]|nr:hypothetical protein BDR07DRAFT_1391772 [Suillus spraguei]